MIVTLYGGNDGLNTVIPYADPAYHDARPDLAYADGRGAARSTIALGLNPAHEGPRPSCGRGERLAVVRGVGYPKPDHSHFRSMDIWQTASPDTPVNTGWIGRWLDATGDDPVRAVNIGAVLPPLAVGAQGGRGRAARWAATLPLPGARRGAHAGWASADPADSPSGGAVAASYRAERTAAATFDVGAGRAADPAATTIRPPAARRRPAASGSLKAAARRRRPLHQGRRPDAGVLGQPRRLRHPRRREGHPATQLGVAGHGACPASSRTWPAIRAAEGRGRWSTPSSAGGSRPTPRRAPTTAPPARCSLAGRPVRGGFYGDQPSLTDLDDGDLKVTIDFRAVYGELLDKVLDTDPAGCSAARGQELGFLA